VTVLAQSLLEYGALNAFITSISSGVDAVQDWIEHQNPAVLLGVTAIVIIVVVFKAFR
jgi:hypothetical protein